MERIYTEEKTLNKNVKAMIRDNFKSAKKLVKRHVAGIGYVHYIKDEFNKVLGHVHKDNGQMIINVSV